MGVVWTRDYVRLKALMLENILNTHIMDTRPIENFLHALEPRGVTVFGPISAKFRNFSTSKKSILGVKMSWKFFFPQMFLRCLGHARSISVVFWTRLQPQNALEGTITIFRRFYENLTVYVGILKFDIINGKIIYKSLSEWLFIVRKNSALKAELCDLRHIQITYDAMLIMNVTAEMSDQTLL